VVVKKWNLILILKYFHWLKQCGPEVEAFMSCEEANTELDVVFKAGI
jgi:hypothetical protein